MKNRNGQKDLIIRNQAVQPQSGGITGLKKIII
jgi:hypothetical protein